MFPLKIIHPEPSGPIYGDEALALARRHTSAELEDKRKHVLDEIDAGLTRAHALRRRFLFAALVVSALLSGVSIFATGQQFGAVVLLVLAVFGLVYAVIDNRTGRLEDQYRYETEVFRLASAIRAEFDAVAMAAFDVRIILPPPLPPSDPTHEK